MVVNQKEIVYAAALVILALTGCRSGLTNSTGTRNPLANWTAPVATQRPRPTPMPGRQQMVEMQFELASSLEQRGEIDAAIHAYETLAAKHPRSAIAQHRLAVLHDKKGQYESSAKHYKLALERKKNDPALLCDYGYSLYLQQRYPEAEAQLRESLRLDANLARAHNNLALVLARTGRHEESLAEFARAGCDESQARVNLAHSLLWDQRWTDAEQQIRRALYVNPTSPAAQQALAMLPDRSPQPTAQFAAAPR